MIEFHFTLTETEYLEAQSLFVKQNKKLMWFRYVAATVFVICIALLVARSYQSDGLTIDESFPQIVPLAVMAILALGLPWLMKRGFRKRFKLEKSNLTNVRTRLDEDGYHVDIPGIGKGVAAWESMTVWLEGETVVMIKSGLLMRIFPKSALNDDQMQEVRKLLTQEIGPMGVSREKR